MADQRLIDYIRDNMRRGYSADYLTEVLVNSGWDINEVREAIDIVEGRPQAQPALQPPVPPPQMAETKEAKKPSTRPRGVTIICVLGFLSSVLMLLAGLAIVSFSYMIGIIGGITTAMNQTLLFSGNHTGLLGTGIMPFLGIVGIMFVILALVEFAGYYLLWKMKKLGWLLMTTGGVITLLLYAISFSVDYLISIALLLVVIAYLLLKRKLFV